MFCWLIYFVLRVCTNYAFKVPQRLTCYVSIPATTASATGNLHAEVSIDFIFKQLHYET
jgi:hypothetical protein